MRLMGRGAWERGWLTGWDAERPGNRSTRSVGMRVSQRGINRGLTPPARLPYAGSYPKFGDSQRSTSATVMPFRRA